MIGSSLLHFQIVREIGTGVTSIVYEALDTKLERRVALKLLFANTDLDTTVQARFLQEARIISKFDHPNIGMIYSLETIASQPFFVMALYQGETLASRIFKTKLEISTIVQFALEIAKALEHAHGHQVLHRDIKPTNIFIAKDAYGTEHIKVLDFGLAKLEQYSQKLTKPNHMIGTMLYASPEQLKGQFVAQSDLWAWACVVYEMLTQTAPFSGSSINEVLHKILMTEPYPLKQMRSDVPDSLAYLVTKCLEKNPDHRIQTAHELVILLEQYLQDIKSPFNSTLTPFLLPTVSFPKAKLPVPSTEFIGRDAEIKQIIETLQMPMTQLVSLVGLGGMGKTWLALEVARRLQDSFRDGVVFVDLTRIEDARFLPNSILTALKTYANQDPLSEMLSMISFREMLLVLDNFEHIMSAKSVIAQMLKIAPKLQILLTSRENLGLQAEMIIELGGFPEPTHEPLQFQSSGKVFLNSARRVSHNFVFQSADHTPFKQIFKALGGSPLGLSLAGSWTRVLNLPEIAKEIETNLILLETSSPDIPTRQRSFAAVFHSSWRHLSAIEQTVLTKLTVFSSGFRKEWAKQVAGADLQILQSLIQKSLISRKNNRYIIHELVQQFAEQEITLEAQIEARNALASCCLALSMQYEKNHLGFQRRKWITNLDANADSIRSVIEMAVKNQVDRHFGTKILVNLQSYWVHHGLQQDAIAWCELLLSKEPTSEDRELLGACITLAIRNFDFRLANQKLLLFEGMNKQFYDLLSVGQYYFYYGRIEYVQGSHKTAQIYFEEAILVFREVQNPIFLADTLARLAVVHLECDELEIAETYLQESIKLNDLHGNYLRKAFGLHDLSLIARLQNEYQKEASFANEALEMAKQIGDPILIAHGLTNLAGRLEDNNEVIKAEVYLLEATKIFFKTNQYNTVANNIWYFGGIRVKSNQFETGIILIAAANAAFAKTGSRPFHKNWQEIQTELYTQTKLLPEQLKKLEQQGASLSPEGAINYAIQTMTQAAIDIQNTIQWS